MRKKKRREKRRIESLLSPSLHLDVSKHYYLSVFPCWFCRFNTELLFFVKFFPYTSVYLFSFINFYLHVQAQKCEKFQHFNKRAIILAELMYCIKKLY